MWAAEGLAHTCYLMYADQPSGLGAELVLMDRWEGPEGWKGGRWIESVERWEKEGGAIGGGKPPGVEHLAEVVKPGEGRMDYSIRVGTYLSRPEVCFSFPSLPFPCVCLSRGI
jgi:mannosyl-oligosaccharide alpha-1,2-mannosidase